MVYVFLGRAGSGKTTVLNALKSKGYKAVISYTTRPKREGETTEYNFITEEEFKNLKYKIAPVKFGNYQYTATRDSFVSDKEPLLYIAEPSALKELQSAGIKFIPIYFEINEDTSVKRMLLRGDAKDKIAARIKLDNDMMLQFAKDADSVLKRIKYRINSSGNIEDVISEVEKIIRKDTFR